MRAGLGRGCIEERGYLVDNSILQKLSRSKAIRKRFQELILSHPSYTCPPQVLEYCWSARNSVEHAELRKDMELFTPAVSHPPQQMVLDIQQAGERHDASRRQCGWHIAAYAIVNDLTLVNCDRDFEFIAGALRTAIFRQEFIAE